MGHVNGTINIRDDDSWNVRRNNWVNHRYQKSYVFYKQRFNVSIWFGVLLFVLAFALIGLTLFRVVSQKVSRGFDYDFQPCRFVKRVLH